MGVQQEEDKYKDSDKDCYCYNPAAAAPGGGIAQRGVEGVLPVLRLALPSPLGPKPSCSSYFFCFLFFPLLNVSFESHC